MSSSLTDPKQIRIFGAVACAFFSLLGLNLFFKGRLILAGVFGALGLLGFGFLLFPVFLTPVYLGWLKVSRVIGKVMNAIILTLAFYLAVAPVALIKKIFSKEPSLPLAPNPEAETYWVVRTETAQPRKRFTKRY